jgi:hypothetical protein
MAKQRYWDSVLQPIFDKVVKTIKSTRNPEQLEASQRYAELFLKIVRDRPDIGYLPSKVNRGVLYFYYNTKISELIKRHRFTG